MPDSTKNRAWNWTTNYNSENWGVCWQGVRQVSYNDLIHVLPFPSTISDILSCILHAALHVFGWTHWKVNFQCQYFTYQTALSGCSCMLSDQFILSLHLYKYISKMNIWLQFWYWCGLFMSCVSSEYGFIDFVDMVLGLAWFVWVVPASCSVNDLEDNDNPISFFSC